MIHVLIRKTRFSGSPAFPRRGDRFSPSVCFPPRGTGAGGARQRGHDTYYRRRLILPESQGVAWEQQMAKKRRADPAGSPTIMPHFRR